jgi:murein DD-endopeptidase MepM/ murein hydrolase activator NlpD
LHVPLRPTGRHRRPRNRSAGAPVYAATVALAAAAVGGLNAPQAVGDDVLLAAPEGLSPDTDTDAAVVGTRTVDNSAADKARRTAAARVAEFARAAEAEAKREATQAREQRRRQALRAARAARAERREAAEERAREAEERARKKWVVPTTGFRLTADFGNSGSLWSSGHTGQDFATSTGTKVLAAAAGTVVSAGYEGSYGNKIIMRHEDGTETWYAHLSSFEVRSGTEVAAGELIGRVGSTGNSTGPHLHFEVRPDGGGPVNPMPWLRDHGVDL